jgi:hypothetical protein
MADPIEIVHPDKPHNQRDIDTAMLESAMLKSGATLAMMKSAAAEYEELGKIKSVAEYRTWVSAFKRREQMALATFAAAGSSNGLVHFEVDFSSSAGSSHGLVPSPEHAESSRIPELSRREFKGLMERRIENIIAGPLNLHVDPTFKNDLEAAYAKDDMETLRNVTALVQQQREEESKAKKQKTSKNDYDEEQVHVPFSMLELMVEARAAGGDDSRQSQSQRQRQSQTRRRLSAYAQDDLETICNMTALVQQQQERQKKARKQDAAASESNAKKQKTGKNDHDDDDRDSAVDTVSKTLESRLHLRQRLNRAFDMIEAPFRCQQCAGQGCDYCEWIGVTPSCQTEPVISDRVNHD